MLRFLYTLIFTLCMPVVMLRLWLKERKLPGFRRRWIERFGLFASLPQDRPVIWLHAVSLGEVVAASGIIERLLADGRWRLMITTTTATGSAKVIASFGDRVHHVYMPYDLPGTVAAFLRRVAPRLVIIMETELWPNTLKECARRRIPVVLSNARMSQRSAQGYARFGKFTQRLLGYLTEVAVQNQDDGQRFLDLGLAADKLTVIGNVKFDISLPAPVLQAAAELRREYGDHRPVWIAASTHDGEDGPILQAFRAVLQRHPSTLLLLVPRHPERFDAVFQLCVDQGFGCVRRSCGEAPTADTQIVVGDTIGEMMMLYGCADMAFVGGSLIDRGGHNMIEPACWGLPIVCGPHTFNFADISRRLQECGGMVTVHDAETLAAQLLAWLDNISEQRRVGNSAHEFAEKNRGAVARLMKILQPHLDKSTKKISTDNQ